MPQEGVKLHEVERNIGGLCNLNRVRVNGGWLYVAGAVQQESNYERPPSMTFVPDTPPDQAEQIILVEALREVHSRCNTLIALRSARSLSDQSLTDNVITLQAITKDALVATGFAS